MRSDNPIIDNILNRTSIRKFTDEDIDDSTIDILLRAGMAAPSALNKQPWEFIVVKDNNIQKQFVYAYRGAWMAENAAVAIVICGNTDQAIQGEEQLFWIDDVAAATENILLAAHSLGLGAVWTGIHANKERPERIKEILSLPCNIEPFCAIMIGHPAESPAPKDKFSKDKIHYNKW